MREFRLAILAESITGIKRQEQDLTETQTQMPMAHREVGLRELSTGADGETAFTNDELFAEPGVPSTGPLRARAPKAAHRDASSGSESELPDEHGPFRAPETPGQSRRRLT
jgi:hypothetical protein